MCNTGKMPVKKTTTTKKTVSVKAATKSTLSSAKHTGGYKLLVVESPSKARTISKYLGSGFKVIASIGHVRDLPKSSKTAIDIEHGYKPNYIVSPGKQKVITEIQELARGASEVLLATDPDREGEAIAWHISEAVHLKNPQRVTYREITKEAILEAISHPRKIDNNLRVAQEARRVLDRLVGYELSGLIWKKVRYGLSAGRVQSPALRILMEREREIRAFIPERYFIIDGEFGVKDISGSTHTLKLVCSDEPKTEDRAHEIVSVGKNSSWKIASIDESEVKRSPKAPFTTSTLQQAA
ncbi:MAG: hypothetical protein RIQ72_125, partial [Candidatus Parcubacteria bacterium]